MGRCVAVVFGGAYICWSHGDYGRYRRGDKGAEWTVDGGSVVGCCGFGELFGL